LFILYYNIVFYLGIYGAKYIKLAVLGILPGNGRLIFSEIGFGCKTICIRLLAVQPLPVCFIKFIFVGTPALTTIFSWPNPLDLTSTGIT
jgi:hypothetical protein